MTECTLLKYIKQLKHICFFFLGSLNIFSPFAVLNCLESVILPVILLCINNAVFKIHTFKHSHLNTPQSSKQVPIGIHLVNFGAFVLQWIFILGYMSEYFFATFEQWWLQTATKMVTNATKKMFWQLSFGVRCHWHL